MLKILQRELIVADRGDIEINDLGIELRLDMTALNKLFIVLVLMLLMVMLLLVLLVNLLISTDLNCFGGTWL